MARRNVGPGRPQATCRRGPACREGGQLLAQCSYGQRGDLPPDHPASAGHPGGVARSPSHGPAASAARSLASSVSTSAWRWHSFASGGYVDPGRVVGWSWYSSSKIRTVAARPTNAGLAYNALEVRLAPLNSVQKSLHRALLCIDYAEKTALTPIMLGVSQLSLPGLP